ncbi:MAG: four helix bundle protein [Luteolibacter sp.]
MKNEGEPVYDLEERLLDYGAAIISLTRKLNGDYAERHIGNQLLRSGTAPLSHHGEAQAAESPADFIHKLRIALKELRESERWLKLINRAEMVPPSCDFPKLLDETDQLIRIFVTSIATAEKRRK